jgi:superfamily II DNA/RNA helicase
LRYLGTTGVAITFTSNEVEENLLKSICEQYAANIEELPDIIPKEFYDYDVTVETEKKKLEELESERKRRLEEIEKKRKEMTSQEEEELLKEEERTFQESSEQTSYSRKRRKKNPKEIEEEEVEDEKEGNEVEEASSWTTQDYSYDYWYQGYPQQYQEQYWNNNLEMWRYTGYNGQVAPMQQQPPHSYGHYNGYTPYYQPYPSYSWIPMIYPVYYPCWCSQGGYHWSK